MLVKSLKQQHTIKYPIQCSGVGVHSGAQIAMQILPAPPSSGITFIRADLSVNNKIRAAFDKVTDTKLCTAVSNEQGVKVATVEHLMSALWGCGIDNAIVVVNGPEIPVMDGSSSEFVKMIERAGVVPQSEMRKTLEVLKPIKVSSGDKEIILEPNKEFVVDFRIDFNDSLIGKQHFIYSEKEGFDDTLSRARTFGFMKDLEILQSQGLAKGASLKNAIGIKDGVVLNDGGLRYKDEFVRHKVLDCIGDLFLAGSRIKAKVIAKKAGHAMNNLALKSLFSSSGAFRYI